MYVCMYVGHGTWGTWRGLASLHTHMLLTPCVLRDVGALVVAGLLGAARHARGVLVAIGALQRCINKHTQYEALSYSREVGDRPKH